MGQKQPLPELPEHHHYATLMELLQFFDLAPPTSQISENKKATASLRPVQSMLGFVSNYVFATNRLCLLQQDTTLCPFSFL